MIAKLRDGWSYLLTKLNAIGSLLLAFALIYPDALGELKALAPVPLQPFIPGLALGWFMLVQVAKAKAIKKAMPPPTKAVEIAAQRVAASAQETADEISEDAKPPA
jgi:hypothetical protein